MKCTTHNRPFCPAAACQREVNARDDDDLVTQIRSSRLVAGKPKKTPDDVPKELRDLLPGLFRE